MIQVFGSAEILLLSQGRQAVKDPRGEGDGVSEQGGNGETQTHGEQSHPASHPAGDTNKNQAISRQKKSNTILITSINLQSRHFHSGLPLILKPSAVCRRGPSPAVEEGFLPRLEFVGARRDRIGKLYELAAEGDLAQEEHEGIQP